MIADVAWVVLHGSGHNSGGASFQVVLGSVVAALVVTGVLWYLGVFHAMAGSGGGSLGALLGGADAAGEAATEVASEAAGEAADAAAEAGEAGGAGPDGSGD